VLIHYSYFGLLLKTRYLHITTAVGGKVAYLYITVAVGSPFESKVAYLHITFSIVGLFESVGRTHDSFRVLNYDVVQKILYELLTIYSPKMRYTYARNTLWRP